MIYVFLLEHSKCIFFPEPEVKFRNLIPDFFNHEKVKGKIKNFGLHFNTACLTVHLSFGLDVRHMICICKSVGQDQCYEPLFRLSPPGITQSSGHALGRTTVRLN